MQFHKPEEFKLFHYKQSSIGRNIWESGTDCWTSKLDSTHFMNPMFSVESEPYNKWQKEQIGKDIVQGPQKGFS